MTIYATSTAGTANSSGDL